MILAGRISSPSGGPVAGAHVAIYPPGRYRALKRTKTDSRGSFSLTADQGPYAITATAPGYSASYLPTYDLRKGSSPAAMTMESAKHFARGVVRDTNGHPVGNAVVRASAWTIPETRLYYTITNHDGSYELGLSDDLCTITVEPGAFVSGDRAYSAGDEGRIDLVAYPWSRVGRPAPDGVVQWIRSQAQPLEQLVLGPGPEDPGKLKQLIGDARIVGLGEATHGTREFIVAKHRLLKFLVTELGFSIFAIEASLPEAMALNDYVLNGQGDPASSLAGLHFWITDTEEMLDTIRWIRAYNSDTSRVRKVRFYGFDMQFTSGAVSGVLKYISRLAPHQVRDVEARLEFFGKDDWQGRFADLSADARRNVTQGLQEVAAVLDRLRADTDDWRRVRRFVVVISQAAQMAAPGHQSSGVRDRAMADNVSWIARMHPDERIALSAANGHISRVSAEGLPSMGNGLAKVFGRQYLPISLVFGHGTFQARNVRLGQSSRPLIELQVGRAPEHYVEAALARVGMPLFAVDLRDRPRTGPVAEWFSMPHPMREFGGTYIPPDYHWEHILVDRHFDVLVYVDRTSRSHPTPTGRRDR